MTVPDQQSIFDQWLHQHRALFFKVVRMYAFNSMDQDDLFQEIAIQVWHSVPSFRGESAVSTWLYRIAFNTAIKWSKRERKHRHAADFPDDTLPVLQSTGPPIEERLAWLYEEIAKLNEVDRSLTLLLLEGMSYKEMSAILGITESNIGVKINRIKKYLIVQSKKSSVYGI
ncbi:MAG: sigma-70 family RNA polymerase sigma factor [Chitinophagaceae bacterium]|nr:sigma-70 family RNA polymerase sigma factor [Chitinophagaceae bacterium]